MLIQALEELGLDAADLVDDEVCIIHFWANILRTWWIELLLLLLVLQDRHTIMRTDKSEIFVMYILKYIFEKEQKERTQAAWRRANEAKKKQLCMLIGFLHIFYPLLIL